MIESFMLLNVLNGSESSKPREGGRNRGAVRSEEDENGVSRVRMANQPRGPLSLRARASTRASVDAEKTGADLPEGAG